MVTINIDGTDHEFAPDSEVLTALKTYPEYYRAGTIGPDIYPDIYFGQMIIHPDGDSSAHQWLTHIWNSMESYSGPDRLKVVAYTYGFVTHAAGDIFGHTYVNHYAGGAWPPLSNFDPNIVLRHIIIETYIEDFTPPQNPADKYNSRDLEVPVDFIYDTLIDNPTARSLGDPFHFNFFLDLKDYLEDKIDSWQDDVDTQDEITICFMWDPFSGDCIAEMDIPDPLDAPFNIFEWAYLEACIAYCEAWVEDIEDGLHAWIRTSTEVGDQLLIQGNIEGAIDAVTDWFGDWFLSMLGFPDIIPDIIDDILDFIGDTLLDFVESIIPSFLKSLWEDFMDVIADARDAALELIFQQAFGISYYDLKEAFTNPAAYLESSLFPPGTKDAIDADMHLYDHDSNPGTPMIYDIEQFEMAYNTVVIGKLCLLDGNDLNDIFDIATGTTVLNDLYASDDHIIVDPATVKSMDGDHQWSALSQQDGKSYGTGDFMYWKDCIARDFLFREIFKGDFPEVNDPPEHLTDTEAPTTSWSIVGPSYTNPSGQLYASSGTGFEIQATDNFWTASGKKAGLFIETRIFPEGSLPPSFNSVLAETYEYHTNPSLPDGKYTLEWRATDKCENIGLTDSVSFYLDNTPPTVTITSPVAGATHESNEYVLLSFYADDGPGCGVDAATLFIMVDGQTNINGQPIYNGVLMDMFLLGPGVHTVYAEAADMMGNLGTKTQTFTVIATIESLQDNVEHARDLGMITQKGVYNALQTKIDNALAAKDRGSCIAMHNMLDAFINQLQAQWGKHVTDLGASLLIALAADAHNRPCT
jgi:hypothetical protein